MQLALAAESRAFGSEIKRTSYIEMQFTYSDIYVFIFIGILSSAIIFSAWHQGGLIFLIEFREVSVRYPSADNLHYSM
jgi:hypothetical protein